MRYLLLQARNPDDPAREHEQAAFREVLEAGPEAVRPWDLLQGPPPLGALEEVDCVLVGGAGEYGVGDAAEHPWIHDFIDLCALLAERGVPTFASCFGFQGFVVACGGRVATDRSRAEVGTFRLSVTAAGEEDPLFGPLAPEFFAQMGHKDHALDLPSGFRHLAGSERSPYQAFALEGRPIYATQFHPELSMERNRERFRRYLAAYSDPDMVDPPDRVLETFRESQPASDLLRRFVVEVLPGGP